MHMIGNTIGNTIGNSIGNTIGNTTGNSIGNNKNMLKKCQISGKLIFFYGVWGTPRTILDPPRHFSDKKKLENIVDASCS